MVVWALPPAPSLHPQGGGNGAGGGGIRKEWRVGGI